MSETTVKSVDPPVCPGAETAAGLMDNTEFARRVNRSVETIRYWRKRGFGPKGFRLGLRVMYVTSEVEQFIATARNEAQ
jgi:hypothetical protein